MLFWKAIEGLTNLGLAFGPGGLFHGGLTGGGRAENLLPAGDNFLAVAADSEAIDGLGASEGSKVTGEGATVGVIGLFSPEFEKDFLGEVFGFLGVIEDFEGEGIDQAAMASIDFV